MKNAVRPALVAIVAGSIGLTTGLIAPRQTIPSQWAFLEPKFSPKGGAREQICLAISRAKKSVRVLAYSFTCPKIAESLVAAHKRGLLVQVVLDESNEKSPTSVMPTLRDAGVPCWLDQKHAIAHNKVIILDDDVVLTGSFNFSNQAEERNAENSVPVYQYTAAYLSDFSFHLFHAKKLN